MPHIFISYAKKDTRTLAETLFHALNGISGVTAWMDMSLEADSSWAGQIQSEIDRCDYMIVLLSPDVNRPIKTGQRRSFVLNEIDYAQQEDKTILPVMVQNTRMPVQLAGIQYIDLTRTSEDPGLIVQRVCARFGIKHSAVALPTSSRPRMIRPMTVVAGIAGMIATFLLIASLQSVFFPPITPLPTTPIQADSLALTNSATLALQEIGQVLTNTDVPSPSWTPTDEPSHTPSPDPTITNSVPKTDTPIPTHTTTRRFTNTPNLVLPTYTSAVQNLTTQAPLSTQRLSANPTDASTLVPNLTVATVGFPCSANIVESAATRLDRVRSQPYTTAPRAPGVIPGEEIRVLGQQPEGTQVMWYQISRPDGIVLGWIMSEYVILSSYCPS